jgi:perosamine synthetase
MIRLAVPDIADLDIQRVTDVLKSGYLVQGKYVKELEESLVNISDIPWAAVVSSGTAALHLALLALGVKPGDWVIVPAFTFPATANVVENIGANVLLCDVDSSSYEITPDGVEKVIKDNSGKRITALIVVHEFGAPAHMCAFARIAKTHKLKLIEDAACALGTVADDCHPGGYSDIACFSFHPRKTITTGEGGALLSRNEDIIKTVKILRNHGIVTLPDGSSDFVEAGLNYRMTDFQAALAIGQLERFKTELSKRSNIANYYQSHLSDHPYISLPDNVDGHSWQSYMIVLPSSIDRTRFIADMKEHGIETNLGAQALNCMKYYKNKYKYTCDMFKVATRLFKSGLVLPIYGGLSCADVSTVCRTVHTVLKKHVL